MNKKGDTDVSNTSCRLCEEINFSFMEVIISFYQHQKQLIFVINYIHTRIQLFLFSAFPKSFKLSYFVKFRKQLHRYSYKFPVNIKIITKKNLNIKFDLELFERLRIRYFHQRSFAANNKMISWSWTCCIKHKITQIGDIFSRW